MSDIDNIMNQHNCSQKQIDDFYNLMDEIRNEIFDGKICNKKALEDKILGVFHPNITNSSVVNDILKALNEDGQYQEVYRLYEQTHYILELISRAIKTKVITLEHHTGAKTVSTPDGAPEIVLKDAFIFKYPSCPNSQGDDIFEKIIKSLLDDNLITKKLDDSEECLYYI